MRRGVQQKPASSGDVFSTGQFPICPATHDLGIRRLFDLGTLLLLLDCRPGDRVLDLGAGPGFSTEMMARLGYNVVAVDPDVTSLQHNRTRLTLDRSRIHGAVHVVSAVGERLPLGHATCDGILGMNVLHHVRDMRAALDELARVLKPGCRAVFVEPGLDHLTTSETQRAIAEHGEDDQPFDVFAFLHLARERGFKEAMLSATLQSALRLLPIEEVELYLSGNHPRPHMTRQGVVEELHRRHAFAMVVRDGERRKTSRHPGTLRAAVAVTPLPRVCTPGATLRVTATVANTGDTLWYHAASASGGFVTFGCKLKTAAGMLVDDTVGRTFLRHDVVPGETTSVEATLHIPPDIAPGEYELHFDMVVELQCWFSDVSHAGPAVPITIVKPA